MPSRSASQLSENDICFTEHAKERVRQPIGQLLTGSPEQVASQVKAIIDGLKPAKTIIVGDRSSTSLDGQGVRADIYVVDGRVERRASEAFVAQGADEIRVSNPAGKITREAWSALREALRRKSPVVVRVHGEEDLLTIAAVEAAPHGSLVLYGQPGKGLVAVKVTRQKKKELRDLLRGLVH